MEPLDFEDVLLSRPPDVEPGPLRDLIEFPADDLELLKQPRECRTTESGVPEDGCVLHTHRHLTPSPKLSSFNSRPWTPVWPWANYSPSLILHFSIFDLKKKKLLLLFVDVLCVCVCVIGKCAEAGSELQESPFFILYLMFEAGSLTFQPACSRVPCFAS